MLFITAFKKFYQKLCITLLLLCLLAPYTWAKDLVPSSLELMVLDPNAPVRSVLTTPKVFKNNIHQLLEKPSTKEPVHIVLPIGKTPPSTTAWQNAFTTFKTWENEIVISLVPEEPLETDTYITFIKTFHTLTKRASADNIYLVAYPQAFDTVSLYDLPEIWGIGLSYTTYEDQPLLDSIYETFAQVKPLLIREDIASYYGSKTSEGVVALNAFYYNIALDYPCIQTIFYDSENLKADKPYSKFYTQLLAEPWIDKSYPTSLQALNLHKEADLPKAYQPLTEYRTLDKNSKLLVQVKEEKPASIHCIQYSLNGEIVSHSFTAPFLFSFNPEELYNGVGRLEVKAFDKAGNLLESTTQDVLLSGNAPSPKAPRMTPSYALEQKSTYTKAVVPVLMYHVFSEAKEPNNPFITVGIERFEEQLKALLDNGYTFITFKDLDLYLKGEAGLPEKPIILTADDGYLDNYTLAFPVLQKYQVPATFFVPPGIVGIDTGNLHFTWEQAKQMEESGLIDIQIHGYDHTPFTLLPLKDVYYQVSRARGVIEKHLGARDVVAISYPEFRHTQEMQKLLTQMGVAFQTTDTQVALAINREDIKRINVPHSMTPEKLLQTLASATQ
ncbi:polysaccharide deacetylase family protein [Sporanaerobium hydrogeniformans]|uniref:polysaccharide deacetylase family protein n=1 Tax=Sporanaerobium hydrogeniformans TaxID=3072179 RepID=UPI0015D50910|nr:polysaccharide deacetylase family protein [Sporanaerobium hydrogeniformans]